MKRYSEELCDRLPAGMTMPPMLIQTMNWLEDQGGRRMDMDGQLQQFSHQTLYLYPVEAAENTHGTTLACFGWDDLRSKPSSDNPDDDRCFFFVSTGGDGSVAGFWLDDDGKQWIVHQGSGSGSDWWGLLSDDPADLLRFLAIGYREPAFYECHGLTPMQDAIESSGADTIADMASIIAEGMVENADGLDAFIAQRDALAKDLMVRIKAGENLSEDYPLPYPPRALQTYLKDTFGIDTPDRAADFMPHPAIPSDEPITDPYAIWLQNVQGEPSAEELAYIDHLQKIAVEVARVTDPDYKPSLWERVKNVFLR